MGKSKIANRIVLTVAILASAAVTAAAAETLQFDVALPAGAAERPITGRLFVFLTARDGGEPRFGPNWFAPEPFFGLDVTDFQPGQTRTIDRAADGFPEDLSLLPAGKYRAQALLDHDFDAPSPAHGVGNLYSDVVSFSHEAGKPQQISLTLDKSVAVEPFPESQWVKEVVHKSQLLSAFHKREVHERASIVLPASYYGEANKRYPVIYEIPGFGSSHKGGIERHLKNAPEANEGEEEFIRVKLSGQCKWGHHVYANSATNGPRGDALVKELLQRIDADFRTVGQPHGRFLSGHSSGGWAALWLQVNYPDTFGGVWASAPDPLDFRNYQEVDLYHSPPLSLYIDESGARRPIARQGEMPVLWYDSFGRMDDVISRGGQLRSFEAVFSPLGKDGLPQKLWDRGDGRIDPAVAKAWEAYDVRLVIERNWPALKEKLSGKLHITVGSLDTFYLTGSIARFAEAMQVLGSDAEITIVPGANHFNLYTPEYAKQVRRQMSERYRKSAEGNVNVP